MYFPYKLTNVLQNSCLKYGWVIKEQDKMASKNHISPRPLFALPDEANYLPTPEQLEKKEHSTNKTERKQDDVTVSGSCMQNVLLTHDHLEKLATAITVNKLHREVELGTNMQHCQLA